MTRMDHVSKIRTVPIYTGHSNLVYIHDPLGQNPRIARHTMSEVMGWALKLSEFRFIIEHIEGERNVWADLLTRCAAYP